MSFLLPGIFLITSLLISLRYLHMLQLASYQTPGYWRWLKANIHPLSQVLWPAFIVLVLGLWPFSFMIYPASVLLILAAVFQQMSKAKAKKPLKMTARAWRIFVTHILLNIGIAVLGLVLLTDARETIALSTVGRVELPLELANLYPMLARLYYLWFGAFFLAQPLVMMLSNWITQPLQTLINNGYIRDAQKRLASHPNLLTIGVTGSFGKTSTKMFLSQLLSVKYNVLATPESYNTPMGVVRTIREKLNATHEIFVCEMGARHVGDIKELTGIAHPKHGVLTSIGEQHLETFHTLDNIIATKYELIDALPPDGIAFLGWGSENVRKRPAPPNAVRYAVSEMPSPELDYRAYNLKASSNGTSFTVTTREGQSAEYRTRLLGAHFVENIVCAIAVSHTLGIPMQNLIGAVRALEPVPHRLQLLPGNPSIIDDAFNANPSGAKAALDTLSLFDSVKILITPGMVELGERQDALNEAFGVQAAAVCDYILLVGKKQTEPILRGVKQTSFPAEKMLVFDTVQQAITYAKGLNSPDSVILLENDLPDNY